MNEKYISSVIDPDSSVGKKICLQCKRPWFDFWVRKICWRKDRLPTPVFLDFPCGSAGKEPSYNVGDLDLIPGLVSSPGEGKGSPLQYSDLENSWTVQSMGLQSRAQLSLSLLMVDLVCHTVLLKCMQSI